MWNHIRRFTGSKPKTVLHPLTNYNKTYNTPTEISNVLAATYSEICSNSNYDSFLNYENKEEKTYPDFSTNSRSLSYNQPVSENEVRTAIQRSQKAAPGVLIMTVMLDHIHTNALSHFTHLLNRILSSTTSPSSWKIALIIPILKPHKDPFLSQSYRPA